MSREGKVEVVDDGEKRVGGWRGKGDRRVIGEVEVGYLRKRKWR